jgi:hypothetical protein
MSIVTIHLPFSQEYVEMIQDIYKLFVTLAVFHVLVILSSFSKGELTSIFSGNMLNDNFMLLVLYLILGIMSYYLVFEKIVKVV